LRIEAATAQEQTVPAHGASRLLGWRGSPEQLLVARNKSFAEEAGMLLAGGGFQPLREEAEPSFVGPYLKSIDEIVSQEPTEDPGDPVRLFLEGSASAPRKRWLAHFGKLRDLALAQEGRSALFVDRSHNTDDPGGDVYIVEAGKEDATLLLRAKPDKVSYSLPTPWP
jgi:hypothetical protein